MTKDAQQQQKKVSRTPQGRPEFVSSGQGAAGAAISPPAPVVVPSSKPSSPRIIRSLTIWIALVAIFGIMNVLKLRQALIGIVSSSLVTTTSSHYGTTTTMTMNSSSPSSTLLELNLLPVNRTDSSYLSISSLYTGSNEPNNNSLYFQNCPPTTGIKLLIPTTSSSHHQEQVLVGTASITNDDENKGNDRGGAGEPWILETYNNDGAKKTVGGDEMYVTYTDNNNIHSNTPAQNATPTAVALVTDLGNGRYELRFKTTPMDPHPSSNNLSGKGTLLVYITFTCGTALAPVPLIINAEEAGFVPFVAMGENISQPPISTFVPPKLDDLSHYKKIIFHGDSLMRNVVTSSGDDIPIQRKLFFQSNVLFRKNLRIHLSNDTTEYIMNQFQSYYMIVRQNFPQVAIVLGSAAWDLSPVKERYGGRYPPDVLAQGSTFDNHIAACRRLVELFRKNYGSVKLFWRLPTAMHPHRQGCKNAGKGAHTCLRRIRYVTYSRSEYLYRRQKKLMEDMNVTVWDLFEALYLSAHYTVPGDVMHYTEEYNRFILDWFYPGQHSGNFTYDGKPIVDGKS
jgi:hypothetical protein